jgi:hypothetical protein
LSTMAMSKTGQRMFQEIRRARWRAAMADRGDDDLHKPSRHAVGLEHVD